MKVSGEFLIFLLLLITNSRVFFVESRKDAIVLLSPLAFFLSVFQILSWGFDPFTGTAFFLSILVLFSNFHALYRYFERLYVDHYTPLMYIWAISTTIASVLCLGILIYFLPSTPLTRRKVNESAPDVTLLQERYNGSFRSGFVPAALTQKTNILLYTFEPSSELKERKQSDKLPVILFFPDKRAETYHYVPYILKLAENGYTVISSDINVKDSRWLHNPLDSRPFRRFGMIIASLSNPFKFNSQTEFYTYNSSLECNALFDILDQKYGDKPEQKYILASDFMANTAISDFQKSHQNKIAGLFYMDELSATGDYQTPGYGFVAYTDPLLATILKVERDKTGYSPNLCAKKTVETISKMQADNGTSKN